MVMVWVRGQAGRHPHTAPAHPVRPRGLQQILGLEWVADQAPGAAQQSVLPRADVLLEVEYLTRVLVRVRTGWLLEWKGEPGLGRARLCQLST
jgi:hypothetical protein